MLEVRRGQYGYFVECEQCSAVLEITHEDVEDGWIDCDNCGAHERIGDNGDDELDEDEQED